MTRTVYSVAEEPQRDRRREFAEAESAFRVAELRSRICLAGGRDDDAERVFGAAETALEDAREALLAEWTKQLGVDVDLLRRVLG